MIEVMVHPDRLLDTARRLESDGDLVVVVEHAGWPRNGSDEERALWTAGIDALAGLGDNVLCKLSGLAGPLGSMAPGVLAPWLEHAIGGPAVIDVEHDHLGLSARRPLLEPAAPGVGGP